MNLVLVRWASGEFGITGWGWLFFSSVIPSAGYAHYRRDKS